MATPHIASVAALIKHKHPKWSPSVILSVMMTTADAVDHHHALIQAQQAGGLTPSMPFDLGLVLSTHFIPVGPEEGMVLRFEYTKCDSLELGWVRVIRMVTNVGDDEGNDVKL
ncbi:Peptidase S8/S53 domain [Dillenia turbinata]|uniref:Peptidase S8/S53 domain n=1 Tax=Dillenia turbinata TaxID=194707 RepID=A0AAN8ZC55_9MAGN